jgi:hypothetical protein
MRIAALHNNQHHTARKQLQNALPEDIDKDIPPAKMANLPTETAAEIARATLSSAVDHFPVALSNTSVALNHTAAVPRIRKHALKLQFISATHNP